MMRARLGIGSRRRGVAASGVFGALIAVASSTLAGSDLDFEV
jgi:hypothetical protein